FDGRGEVLRYHGRYTLAHVVIANGRAEISSENLTEIEGRLFPVGVIQPQSVSCSCNDIRRWSAFEKSGNRVPRDYSESEKDDGQQYEQHWQGEKNPGDYVR